MDFIILSIRESMAYVLGTFGQPPNCAPLVAPPKATKQPSSAPIAAPEPESQVAYMLKPDMPKQGAVTAKPMTDSLPMKVFAFPQPQIRNEPVQQSNLALSGPLFQQKVGHVDPRCPPGSVGVYPSCVEPPAGPQGTFSAGGSCPNGMIEVTTREFNVVACALEIKFHGKGTSNQAITLNNGINGNSRGSTGPRPSGSDVGSG